MSALSNVGILCKNICDIFLMSVHLQSQTMSVVGAVWVYLILFSSKLLSRIKGNEWNVGLQVTNKFRY